MTTPTHHTLILGWGNPGRGDDGLGPEFIRVVEDLRLPGVEVGSNYQLQVEDAAEVARFRRVLFVDADRTGAAPFWLRPLHAQVSGLSFSTHSVAPAAILALGRDLFGAAPEAWILGIRGYEFDEFREQLSEEARSNLDQAVKHVKSAVVGGGLQEFPSPAVGQTIINDHEDELCLTRNP